MDRPVWKHWLHEFTREHTLIRYDERANGLSDWDTPELSLEAFVEDLETVERQVRDEGVLAHRVDRARARMPARHVERDGVAPRVDRRERRHLRHVQRAHVARLRPALERLEALHAGAST